LNTKARRRDSTQPANRSTLSAIRTRTNAALNRVLRDRHFPTTLRVRAGLAMLGSPATREGWNLDDPTTRDVCGIVAGLLRPLEHEAEKAGLDSTCLRDWTVPTSDEELSVVVRLVERLDARLRKPTPLKAGAPHAKAANEAHTELALMRAEMRAARRAMDAARASDGDDGNAKSPTQGRVIAPGSVDNDEYRPASWFKKGMAARLRMAASKDRKTKRVRRKRIDGVWCYSVADARQWWPADVPDETRYP